MTPLVLVLLLSSLAQSACVNYATNHWYKDKLRQEGLPKGFTGRPKTISVCELEQLHRDCINVNNMYRNGTLKFNDGTNDANVLAGLDPLIHTNGGSRCSSAAAMGDLYYNVQNNDKGNGCIGGHNNAHVCDWKLWASQNSCCARGSGAWGPRDRKQHLSYESVRTELFNCARKMWNEGIRDIPENQKGHWRTMRSTKARYLQCGFAWTKDGRVVINMDYSRGKRSYPTCSCNGKSHGEPDGCGNKCFEPGVWYCRQPGTAKGPFRREWCVDPDVKVVARCCKPQAGPTCSKEEKLRQKWRCPRNLALVK